MSRPFLLAGAIAGFAAVAVAAWGAHAAAAAEPATARAIAAAGAMLALHAPTLLAVGLWAERTGAAVLRAAGTAMALGVLLFAAGALGGVAGWRTGPVAPIGGVLLLLGWAGLAVAALRR